MYRAVQFSMLIKSQSYRWLLSNEHMMCTWYIPLDLLCQLLLMQTKQLLIRHVWSAVACCWPTLYPWIKAGQLLTVSVCGYKKGMDTTAGCWWQTNGQTDRQTAWLNDRLEGRVIVIWPFMCMFAYGHPSFGSQFDLILNKKPFFSTTEYAIVRLSHLDL